MRSVQVVVVHGIGSQKVGQMASRWSEALVRFAAASGLRGVVRDAQLVDDPATVRIEIGAHGAEPSYELCVREAYWANAFAEPSVGRVLRFLLTIAPALAITQTILIWQERKAIWGRSAGTGSFRPSSASPPWWHHWHSPSRRSAWPRR